MTKSMVAFCAAALALAGCAMPVEEATATAGLHPDDVKPEDGSELASAALGSSQQAHALHYTDGTNQWLETAYPMGTDNPNCKDWYVYDRWLSSRPIVGTTRYTTFDTNHYWARGTYVDTMMKAIPESLGYTPGRKLTLIDHNSIVARGNGLCSGRYVFQWDNRTNYGPFEATSYYVTANIPDYFIPGEQACKATAGESIPSTLVDLYVCEAPNSASVGSIGSWCGKSSGNWRKVPNGWGSTSWDSTNKKCYVGASVYYPKPTGKVAVSFNMVIKSGIGHGVAPAEFWIVRYAN
jgi:hypothetical protein